MAALRPVAGAGLDPGERKELDRLAADAQASPAEVRFEALRSILRLQERIGARLPPTPPGSDPGLDRLAELARQALATLGGSADPPTWSLREYDADLLGPLFGVSDDGDAAPQIVRALLDSPKANVLRRLGLLTLRTIGACVDAERMSAAGELLVGVDEYARVRSAVAGRVPMTTNVGTIVLPRFFHPMPFVTFKKDVPNPEEAVFAEVKHELEAFTTRPEGLPRLEITVYVAFRGGDEISRDDKVRILRTLAGRVRAETSSDPNVHRLGLLQRASERGSEAPMLAIDMAADAGISHVMIEGDARFESQDQLFLPGLLQYFEPRRVNQIVEHGRRRRVVVVPKNEVDVGTAARTIWSGLTTARSMGTSLGKFGLFPLRLEQQLESMRLVRSWFPEWTPAPAFYVDRPTVTAERVFVEREIVEPAVRWIRGASEAGLDVVLIDSPDRTPAPAGSGVLEYRSDRGRRLLKLRPDDRLGVLADEDIERIDAAARACSPTVRVLWAGGLDGRQAFALARRKAFGIFTTSTTARRVAVAGGAGDPTLTAEMEPTYLGVLGVRMVIEAGFLSAVARDKHDQTLERRLGATVEPVLAALGEGLLTSRSHKSGAPILDDLRTVLERAWEEYLAGIAGALT